MKFATLFAGLVTGVAAAPALSSRKVTGNWAGASKAGTGWNMVTGTVVIPDVTGSAPNDAAAIWVGIDGKTCHGTLWQTGVTVRGNGKINGWHEWIPGAPQPFDSDFVCNAGDTVRMTVTATSPTSGVATLENLTTGTKSSQTVNNPDHPMCQTDADWIVEDFSQLNLANFGTIEFTDTSASSSAGSDTPAGSSISEVVADGVTRTSCSASASGVECKWVQ